MATVDDYALVEALLAMPDHCRIQAIVEDGSLLDATLRTVERLRIGVECAEAEIDRLTAKVERFYRGREIARPALERIEADCRRETGYGAPEYIRAALARI
jgi:hypothetical protein